MAKRLALPTETLLAEAIFSSFENDGFDAFMEIQLSGEGDPNWEVPED